MSNNKPTLSKILQHPDKDELISKVIVGISPKDIHDWLAAKYPTSNEKKFVISEKMVKTFKDSYLDVYSMIQSDIQKTKLAVASNAVENLELSVRNNSTYQSKLQELATKEIDVRKMIAHLCLAVETRLGQIFDSIQDDPNNINTKVDRVWLEYAEVLGGLLERYYKFTESPADLTIQHNVTLQVVDQHIAVFHEAIREVLAELDLESSMLFMEKYSAMMAKLKPPTVNIPNTDIKLAEAKVINETINKKLNE
jgi:trans-aconitate methyltransferase